MGFQGRKSNSIKKVVNAKTKGRRDHLGKEARLLAALSHGSNNLINDCATEKRTLGSLKVSGRDIYEADTEQIRRWIEFATRYMFLPPLIVRGDMVVWGEDILDAARWLEMPDLSCFVADHLNDQEIGLVKIAMHQQVALREVDSSVLRVILEDADPTDFDFTFLSSTEIDVILLDDPATKEAEEELPEMPSSPVTALGDVFILANVGSFAVMPPKRKAMLY
ncbi:MAG TPA: hypothetical protein VN150_01130 [Ochrobactrum sp.]|nr:hypothetical protein [Ochrobactrum sp.]